MLIYSNNEPKPAYIIKICLLGQAGVGKTCICKRLALDVFEAYTKPTIGLDFYKYDLPILIKKEEKICRLSIWDFGGQEQFKKFFQYYISGAHGIFMVFDLSDVQSLIQLDWWHEKLVEFGHKETPKMHVGTKLDLIKENTDKLKSNELVINRFLEKQNENKFIKTSSKDNINVLFAFKAMIKKVLNKYNFDFDEIP